MSLAIADDLLRCDWFGRIKLIITRAVRHLAIATLRMIGGDVFLVVWLLSWISGYLSILCLWGMGVVVAFGCHFDTSNILESLCHCCIAPVQVTLVFPVDKFHFQVYSFPLYRSTCISRHLQLRIGGFCWCKVLLSACPCWRQELHTCMYSVKVV